MSDVVTGIVSVCDEAGNFLLEVTTQDGSLTDVVVPPEMAGTIRTTIQENEARRLADQAGYFGTIILDVKNIKIGTRKGTLDATLVLDTEQLGWWGFRFEASQARQLSDKLNSMLRPRAV